MDRGAPGLPLTAGALRRTTEHGETHGDHALRQGQATHFSDLSLSPPRGGASRSDPGLGVCQTPLAGSTVSAEVAKIARIHQDTLSHVEAALWPTAGVAKGNPEKLA